MEMETAIQIAALIAVVIGVWCKYQREHVKRKPWEPPHE